MILRKYLHRELIQTFLATFLVLILIATSNKLVSLITKAAIGEFPANVLMQMIWLQMPEIFAIILPISYFLAILLCFGKLFVDLEIPVMLACGLSWRFLTQTAILLALPIMLVSACLSLYLSPICYQYRDLLLQEEGPMLLIETVVPGRFHSFQHDKWIFYVAGINSERTELNDIFLAQQPSAIEEGKDWSVLTAKSGKVTLDKKTGNTYVHLYQGKRYQGKPGELDYSVIQFDEYNRLVEQTVPQQGLFYHRSMPTKMLIDNPMPSNMSELQWRLSVPLMTLLLAFFAVPISRLNPRKGRFSKIFIAVLSAIIYINLLTVSKRWVESQVLPAYIGVWWVHIGFFMISWLTLLGVSGRLQKAQRVLKVFKLSIRHKLGYQV